MQGLRIGAGKQEIDVPTGDYGLLGYGQPNHKALARSTPLYSRVFCFVGAGSRAEDAEPLFFAQSEICMVFPELRRAVVERLQTKLGSDVIRPERYLLCSQHTHCGPGGYSHYPFYNFAVPGFRPQIFDAIVDSLVLASLQAWSQREAAQLRFSCQAFADDVDVAFNRSLSAYNRNPDVAKFGDHETHKAIDRRMWLLEARGLEGRCIGQINWFGVHPTSISSRLSVLSSDNKGYAAASLEARLGAGSVAIFAQHFAGDVSPNAQGDTKPDWLRGPTRDEIANARYNGELQSEQAWKIIQELDATHALGVDTLDAALVNRDLSAVEIDPDFADGNTGERTSAPCHGLAFYRGSPVDGPGIREPVVSLVHLLASRARKRLQRERPELLRAQHPKLIVSESGDGVLVGMNSRQFLPSFLDRALAEMQRQDRAGALDELPWVPTVLPLQMLRIGELAIIGFPGEITTVAGQQLQQLCLEALASCGVRHVVSSSYANSYSGYCTTWHEYQAQSYEGGHTMFGSRTHDAFRTEYRRLLRECAKPAAARRFDSLPEKVFSAETLAKRSVR